METTYQADVDAITMLLVGYMGRQQHLDSAIVNTILGLLAANAGLLGALQLVEQASVGKLLPIVGLASAFISTLTVGFHRSRLRKTSSDGCAIQSHIANMKVTLGANPFSAKDGIRGWFHFSGPDMVHIAIALVWVGLLGRHIPWIDAIFQRVMSIIF